MSNIQTGAERMPHDLSHLGFLAGQIGRVITISTTPVIAGDSFDLSAVRALRVWRMSFYMVGALVVRLVVLLPFELRRLSLATPSRWTPLALSVFLHFVVALLLTLL